MKFRINIKGKEYTVEISEKGKETKIKVGDKEFFFEREKREKKILIPSVSFQKRNFSKKEILAPIPGTISEVFTKEGNFIKKGDRVVALSAMKMENEIVSEFEGKVKRVLVKKDQKVKEGDTLILLE